MLLGETKLDCGRAAVITPLTLAAVLIADPAPAQNAPPAQAIPQDQQNGALEEITVTARKREESILRAPVLIDVFTAQQVEDFRITDFYTLASAEPDLTIGTGFSTVGAIAMLRGLGNGLGAEFVDQSVLLNIDGESMSQGQFYKTGLFDVGQIEILKGPQSLFYGKGSSAGIIAIHSADPTDHWEAKVSAGHEFVAKETPVDAFISGPLTDELGIRLAGYYSQMQGWLTNPNPYNFNRTYPDGYSAGGRLTLKFDNNNGLRIKLKAAFGKVSDDAFDASINQLSCNGTRPQFQSDLYDTCRIDTVSAGTPNSLPYNPNLHFTYGNTAAFLAGAPSPLFENGQEYEFNQTAQGVLSVDYDITPALTVTSITAQNEVTAQEAGQSYEAAPSNNLVIAGRNVDHNFSQELRLASNYKSWFNFLAGADYDQALVQTQLVVDLPGITFLTDNTQRMTTKTTSFFAQMLLTPIDKWELSVGARYTLVHKYFTSLVPTNNLTPPAGEQIDEIPYDLKNITQGATTPEVTLTYHATDDITAFISYKQGYKGPGFNANSSSLNYLTPGDMSAFSGEKANGGEAGIKAALLDRHLALTASVYNYQYTGLQVGFVDNTTHSVLISPSANARIRGIETTANYLVGAIEGLSLNAAVNYNEAKYMSFPNAPCYGGESVEAGCVTNAAGSPVQNFAGKRLNNAPPWTGRFGYSYRTTISPNYVATWNVDSNFSSGYFYTPEMNPNSFQHKYIMLDSALHFGPGNGRWELALIGRDLFNKVIATVGQDNGVVYPGVTGDALGIAARPRQVLLQVTVRPEL